MANTMSTPRPPRSQQWPIPQVTVPQPLPNIPSVNKPLPKTK